VAGLIVMYIVAALLGVTIEPATGHTSMFNRIVILGITGLVWLVAPVLAVVRARPASHAGSRSGRVALVVSTVLFLLTAAMTISTLVDPGNML
jgi:hypothetical protein